MAMVISLAGEWDIYRREELERHLHGAYESPEVVLDLTGAKYVTSTLIGALVKLQSQREQREMLPAVLAVRSPFVRRLLAVTGVEEIYTIYDSLEEAVAAPEIDEESA